MSSESAIIDDNLHSSFSLQGIEAPRNSLESPQSTMEITHSSSKVKEQTNLNIPVGRMQINTNRSKFIDDLSSECYTSPGTKTPNLVARLMGLDLLPEYSSPRASASSVTTNSYPRTRSLPVTPRLSTASRHSTDNNEYHHRLSLQIDKENCRGQESRKQITNPTRERISRRLGTDITNIMSNTMSSTRSKCPRRDSNLVLLKPRSPAMESTRKAKRDESGSLSRSPKVRLLDIKSNLNKPISNSPKSQTPKKLRETRVMNPENVVKDEKIKRIASERYDLRLKKMSQQQKSTALLNQVVNVKDVKKFQSFKKEMTSSSPTTRLSQKQVSLPSNLNSSYNSNDTHNLKAAVTTTCSFKLHQPTAPAATTTVADWEVFEWNTGRSMQRLLSAALVAEMEDMVVEIESEILGILVQEIVTEMVAPAASDRVRSHVPFT